MPDRCELCGKEIPYRGVYNSKLDAWLCTPCYESTSIDSKGYEHVDVENVLSLIIKRLNENTRRD